MDDLNYPFCQGKQLLRCVFRHFFHPHVRKENTFSPGTQECFWNRQSKLVKYKERFASLESPKNYITFRV